MLSFGPFILVLISSIRLLSARYCHFLIVGQIQPVVTVGPFPAFFYLRPVTIIFCLWAKFSPWLQLARLWPVITLGPFHSVIKYDRLTTTRYGRPMNGRLQL